MENRYTIDVEPEKPEIKTCDKHGDYEVKYLPMGKKVWVFPNCTKCVEEQNEVIVKKDKDDAKQLAIDNEKRRRENARVNAGISKRNLYKTFDDYICSNEGQTKAKADVIKFRDSFPSDKSLLFIGGVGTGKTLLASALIDSLIDKYECGIIKVIDIVRRLKSTWHKDADETESEVLDFFIKADLLIIDEVGSQFGSDTEKLFIFEIIDGRYQDMKQTILISNLDVEGVKEVIGERCIDRLREGGGSVIAFDWKSSRK